MCKSVISVLITLIILTIPDFTQAQVGIGTATPVGAAKLEVYASDKGFMPPRVALTATNSNGPITSPVAGLIVYNTATAGTAPYDVIPGMYFYNGSGWVLMASSGTVPAGQVSAFAGSTAPGGYLICDGSAVSRTTYVALFAVIGTTYGTGDGSTTFNLPDLRSRSIVGVGQGAGLTNRTLASTAGAETKTLTPNEMPTHTHTASSAVTDPGHTHTQWTVNDDFNNSGGNPPGFTGDSAGSRTWNNINSSTTGITVSTTISSSGSSIAFDIMNPFLALNYIIKY